MKKVEHSKYTIQDWINQMDNGRSILGYWDWVSEQSEQANVEKIMDLCPKCKRPLHAKSLGEGGGVECTNKNCGYWFCF